MILQMPRYSELGPRSAFVGSSESVPTPSVFKGLHHAGWIRHPASGEYEYRCTEYEYEYD